MGTFGVKRASDDKFCPSTLLLSALYVFQRQALVRGNRCSLLVFIVLFPCLCFPDLMLWELMDPGGDTKTATWLQTSQLYSG